MTVILLRHGRSTANTSGVLAGRTPGVNLDEKGLAQADDVVARLAELPIEAVVRSPLERCAQTVAPLIRALGLTAVVDDRLNEVDYGDWTGGKISTLAAEPLWATVQRQPSAAVFPGGEAMVDVQQRAVDALRDHDARMGGKLWVACSHGDVIKSAISHAAGAHLDQFQRIVVHPASMSVVEFTAERPYVHVINSAHGQPVPTPTSRAQADAAVGGGAG